MSRGDSWFIARSSCAGACGGTAAPRHLLEPARFAELRFAEPEVGESFEIAHRGVNPALGMRNELQLAARRLEEDRIPDPEPPRSLV
jgi:hypothetical protein